ncbi:MAG: flagellar biosynthesis protein FliQ [Candidatus Krumholzibacteriia bacterium]
MTADSVIDLAQQALRVTLLVSGPMLLAGMLVGLIISIVQAATQINEMTMTFVPKIVVVMLVMVLTLPWIIAQMTAFTRGIFARIAAM